MAKGLVEKYQQILEGDPGSLVFVELAKALLDRGEPGKAAEICKAGLEHHPDSVVGRVLWGKALIGCGRPADAMDQFDQAVAIDKENPSAYNLIGEVLLHKGLFRSAIPILKKAVALQPSDNRVRQWLDQAQRGIKGVAPTSAAPDHTTVDPGPAQADPTVVDVKAYVPGAAIAAAAGLTPIAAPSSQSMAPGADLEDGPSQETVRGLTDVFHSLGAQSGPQTALANPDGPPTQVMPPSVQQLLNNAASPQIPVATPLASAVPAIPPAPGPKDEVPWLETRSAEGDLEGRTVPLDAPPPEALAAGVPPSATGATAPPGDEANSDEVMPGLTGVFQSLAARAQEAEKGQPGAVQVPVLQPVPATAAATAPVPAAAAPASASGTPAAPPAAEAAAPASPATPPPPPLLTPAPMPALPAPAAAAKPAGGGLLPELDLVPDDDEEPAAAPPQIRRVPAGPPPPPKLTPEQNVQVTPGLFGAPPLPPAGASRLLPDLPSMPPTPFASSEEIPSVVLAPEAAADIAREYERELREKLLATPPPTFWRKNWLLISVSAALLAAAVGGFVIYRATRLQNRGTDLIGLRSQAFRALALGTPAGYRQSIELAERGMAMAQDKDCQAAIAYSNAALYRYFGQEPGRKAAAEKLLSAAQDSHPGLALAIPYLVASDPAALEAAKGPLLAATGKDLPTPFEAAEVHSLAGRMLMGSGKTEDALSRFEQATKSDSGHVATLVALGEYYLSSEPEQAARFFSNAKLASPEHVPAILGLVKAKLELGGDPNELGTEMAAAKAAFESVQEGSSAWPAGLRMDLQLVEGRVLGVQGKLADAASQLSNGATEHPERAADFYAALGSIQAFAGHYDQAESAYRKAADRRRDDASLREELARALIARGRFAEAIKAAEGTFADDRRLHVVKGLARLELGQHAKAREELAATSRNGKVPAEAAIYLAMIDAATGQKEVAFKVLQSTSGMASKGRSTAYAALGRMLLDDQKETEAAAAFTKAMADRRDWEGACSLGRLHLKNSRFAEAKQHLSTAVARNKFHLEARIALGQALLALGEARPAQAEFEAALTLSPTPASHRGIARAMMALGDLNGTRSHVNTAAKLDPKDPETGRLAAQLSLAAGDAQEALKGLEKATKAAPRDPVAWCELGETLIKVGNNAKAAAAFDTALKNDRGNPRARLGLVAAALPKNAKRVLREADALVTELDKNPQHKARALALSARVHLLLADKTNAAALAKRAVEADDASADAHFAQALVAATNKDDALAIQELSRVVAADPAIAEAHLALAASLARDPAQLARSISEFEAYLRIAPQGPDAPTAKKFLTILQKKAESATAAPAPEQAPKN
ncbi:MAG TPA: tetratricopeptide repeat protein [Myxococcales bacterium]|jgi:tetratricopeptide (TPR) repeat protein